MLTVTMVGATFRPADAKEIVRHLHIGDIIDLRADPTNNYDTTAVACYRDDVHIGFIPKESNSALFEYLMSGEELTGEVIGFENTLKPILEIAFEETDDFNNAQDEGGW